MHAKGYLCWVCANIVFSSSAATYIKIEICPLFCNCGLHDCFKKKRQSGSTLRSSFMFFLILASLFLLYHLHDKINQPFNQGIFPNQSNWNQSLRSPGNSWSYLMVENASFEVFLCSGHNIFFSSQHLCWEQINS